MDSGWTAHEVPFSTTGERGSPSKPPLHRGLLRVILMTPQLEVNIFSLHSVFVLSTAVVLYSSDVYIKVVYFCSGSVWTALGYAISKASRQSDYG